MQRLSVIVPFFNAERFIENCARSLFGQSLKEAEFIFVDDGSTDSSSELLLRTLEDYPGRNHQVRIIHLEQNTGLPCARLRGLGEATGAYIAFCDSDDTVPLEAYDTLLGVAESGNYDMVTYNMRKEYAPGKWKTVRGKRRGVEDILADRSPCNSMCRLCKRELFLDIETPAVSNVGEDLALTVQLELRTRTSTHVDREFYDYRFNPGSLSKKDGEEASVERLKSLRKNADFILDVLTHDYGYEGNEPVLTAFKYYCRHHVEHYVHHSRVFELWRNTYPEIEGKVLSNPFISLERKFWFVLIHLHLYHPVKCVTRFLFR